MSIDIENSAQSAGVYAYRIENLSIAADCILGGGVPTDKMLCSRIALTILDTIKELSMATQDAANSIEKAVLDEKNRINHA